MQSIAAVAHLALFARAPVPGQVKTRLTPALGEVGACQLHTRLVEHALHRLNGHDDIDLQLWLDAPAVGEPAAIVRHWQRDFSVASYYQCGDDLGERMQHAMATAVAAGALAIVIGADCPGIDQHYVKGAIELLAGCDVVLGPALDGGYVLVASRQIHEGLFSGVRWGSGDVLAHTVGNIARLGLSHALLPPLADIDRPDDLALLSRYGIELPVKVGLA